MDTTLDWFLPYYFYPEVVLFCGLLLWLYTRGLINQRRAGERIRVWPAISFYSGILLIYAMMHTGVDYLAQYLFLGHRAQHLIIHHHAPLLLVLAGLPRVLSWSVSRANLERVRALLGSPVFRLPWRCISHPLVAAFLFVIVIFIWMHPEMHFEVMLDLDLYRIMNASVVLTGLLFWAVMLAPNGRLAGGYSFGLRLLLLWFIMLPQMFLGAYVALVERELYYVYDVCGRAFPITAMTDQRIGGLLTWIPAAEMSAIVAILIIRLWMHEERDHPHAMRGRAVSGVQP